MGSKHKPRPVYVFLKEGDCAEDEVVYAIAQSKEERDRFIKERGCQNMRMVKLDSEGDIMSFGEYLGYPSEIPFLYEYKVGVSKSGEDLSMLMTEEEHDEVMRTIRSMHDEAVKSSLFNGVYFKKKYRNALNIMVQIPLSVLNITLMLFGDTFTYRKEDKK